MEEADSDYILSTLSELFYVEEHQNLFQYLLFVRYYYYYYEQLRRGWDTGGQLEHLFRKISIK